MESATAEFHRELSDLYEAAGRPTLTSLVRVVHDRRPPLRASPTSIGAWLSGRTVPAPASRAFYLVLVTHLQKLAGERSRTYRPRPERYWSLLLDHARRERDSRRGGRPRSAGPAAAAPDARRDVALRSYLAWVADATKRIPVRGLHSASGLVELELDRVYVALKVDSSNQRERAAARDALLRELDARLDDLDLPPEEEERLRWNLYSDLPVADYFGTADRLSERLVEPATVLTIDELYRREAAAVILGDPGSGKTTVMRWLALVHATALLDGEPWVRVASARVDTTGSAEEEVVLGRPLVPILVRVGEYAADRQHRAAQGEPPRGLTDFLGHHAWDGRRPVWLADSGEHRANEALPPEVVADLLTTALRRGQALVVLDGLDEVAAELREDTATAVSDFVRAWTGGPGPEPDANRVFVTSRIAGYHLAPLPQHLPQVTVERMTDQALHVFVRGWIAEIAGAVREPGPLLSDPVASADGLLALLADPANRHARDLASNPLLASVIVSVFLNGGGDLPPQRVELFERAVDALVEAWKRRLGGSFSGAAYQTMLAALPAVAAHIHATKPNGVIAGTEFRGEVVREMARIEGTDPGRPHPLLQDRVDSLLETMRTEVGLLVESGHDSFRFSHQTFQEFLAARHLVAEPACRLARFVARLTDPRWREPILMGLALVNWESADLVAVVRELLAVEGRLTEFFPETALLLAAAVLQMTEVPADAVRAIVSALLAGYASAAGHRRLPRIRGLIEAAVAALRRDGDPAAVEAAFVDALGKPAGSGLPGAAAGIIAAVKAVAPRLAEALAAAADRDDPALGHPITAALGGMMPTGAVARQDGTDRLPEDWRSGRLKMRDLFRRSPEDLRRVVADPRWQSLVLCLYGGQPDLGAASALDEYHRITNYLQLEESSRSGFEYYFGEAWGSDDPVYTMAVHLKTHGHAARWSQPPRFVVGAIWRDSPLTRWIHQTLQRDDLPGLTAFLAGRQVSADPREAADATLALWALGQEQDEFLAHGSTAATLAAVRISALVSQLRDATVRAAPAAVDALVAAAGTLPAAEWDELRQAVTSTLIEAGAPPIEFPDPAALPDQVQTAVLADEFTQHVLGYGDDFVYKVAVFADRIDWRRFPALRLIAALHGRGANHVDGYRLYHYWWPADPLCFTDDDDPVPLAVLDQILRLPAPLSFTPQWLFRDVLAPLIGSHPVLPEALAVAWSSTRRRRGEPAETLDPFDAELAATADPYGHLRGLADRVTDPWYRARALLRLAEIFPARRADLVALVGHAVGEVAEQAACPVRAFQLAERIARLSPAPARADALDECLRCAAAVPDDQDAATALLRTARFLPAPDCDPVVLRAIDRACGADEQARRALLRLALAEFGDRPAIRAAAERVAGGSEGASGGAGAVLARRLPALVGDDPQAAQVWAPVALHARALEVGRRRRTAETESAWARLAAAPDEEAVAAVLAVHEFGLIDCRATVVRAITAAADTPGLDLDPILSRLVRVDCAAEPLVTGWLAHRQPRLRQLAALLLVEYRRLDATTVEPFSELLTDDDDLLRGRARDVLDTTVERQTTHDSVSRLGPAALERLAAFAISQRGYEPSGTLVVSWHLSGVLHDDPAAFRRWCAAVDADGPDASTAAYLLENLLATDDRVFAELLRQLSEAGPALLDVLTRCCVQSIHTNARASEDATLDAESPRWERLRATLSALDEAELRRRRFLVAGPSDVVAATHAALEETGGVLDERSVERAAAALWRSCGTDLGAALTDALTHALTGGTDSATVHARLARIGAQFFVTPGETEDALAAYRELGASAPDRHWPWPDLMARWVCHLLTDSVLDEPGRWERSHALVALQAMAVTDGETLRQLPESEKLGEDLADALMYHNSFPGRAAAAEVLGVLRSGSGPVLQALGRGLRDVTQVRAAALRAYGALRLVDEDLVDDLAAALTGPSSVAAWSAARLLSVIGERASTPAKVRDRIIDLLAAAARDPRSRRTVHFSYSATPIPLQPELDDAVVEALRRVYRIG